ncbi:MAG: cyclic nucleotide-binding/CBS domain-containing protein [Alteromonadaceae bacterium]|nr:cyclic nucleotide-binding/CBS domain-containing protein [Alteromonadaceae bacterium]
MNNGLSEIQHFIATVPPFNELSEKMIVKLSQTINISYLRQENLLHKNQTEAMLYIVRTGALAHFNDQNELQEKYGEGDICALFCYQNSNVKHKSANVKVEEDCLLYSISCQQLQLIFTDQPQILDFILRSGSKRLSNKMTQLNEEAVLSSSLMNTPLTSFYKSPVASITADKNIQQAAIKMTELGFSCLIVLADKNTLNERPIGIVTDKDIRQRCVAQGLSFNNVISDIMTRDMTTIDCECSAYDALISMTTQHIHHLPVTKNNQLVGMVTVTDLMNQEGLNAVNFASIIHKANSVDELASISKMLPKLQIRMAKLGSTADHVGKTISAITMAFTIRLIKMAEKKLGQAPVSYAWLAAGSQARQEQFAHSDQDNALIISDKMQPQHQSWFTDLAHFVSDGLAACGFIYCPGNVMATNTKWRQPQSVWQHYFSQWVTVPEPKALMHASIFFDLNTIYGDESLLQQIRTKMLVETKSNTLFLAHLSKNALQLKPPLGFFRDFVLTQNGNNEASLDLKHNGIAPIVDLARIYALAEGVSAVNTIERIKQVAGSPSLTKSSAANLIDAFEFLGLLRSSHQAKQLQAGTQPDNYLHPKEISRLEREHLKDAFKVVKTLQKARQVVY